MFHSSNGMPSVGRTTSWGLLLWAVTCGAACSGGQTFDDGSDELGRKSTRTAQDEQDGEAKDETSQAVANDEAAGNDAANDSAGNDGDLPPGDGNAPPNVAATAQEPLIVSLPLDPPSEGASLSECEQFDAAELVVSAIDRNCDRNTPESCPPGTHIDFSPEAGCAFCAPDDADNRSCEWATVCFVPFVESVAHTSGAKYCETDDDCSVLQVESSCGGSLPMALRALIDEELPVVAYFFDEQNCGACGTEPIPNDGAVLETAARCADNVCVIAE